MNKNRFLSKLPTDNSNKGYIDPNSTKKPITENTPNQKSEQTATKTGKTIEHVVAPVSVPEYKFVQTKVEQSSPPHAQTRFSLGQQRRTSKPISEPTEKPIPGTDKEEPIRNQKINPQTKVKQVKDHEQVNNTRDKPENPVLDHIRSSQEKGEPVKDYKVINNKWAKPLTTVPDQKYSSPKEAVSPKNYENKLDRPTSQDHNVTYGSPRKSYGVIDQNRDQGYKSPFTKVDETINYRPVENKLGNTSQEIPRNAEEFFTKVQTEASRPARPSLLGGKNWRNEYGEYTNYDNKDLDKPSNGNVRYKQVIESYEVGDKNWRGIDERNLYGEHANYRNNDFDMPGKDLDKPRNGNVRYKQVIESYEVDDKNWRGVDGRNLYGEHANYRNNDSDMPSHGIVRYERVVEPYKGPRKEWVMPPTQATPIYGPTNDIGKAVEILKEAVISGSPPPYRYNYPDSKTTLKDRYAGAIDSTEAQRRFGSPNQSAPPSPKYKRIINSNDAAIKYGGTPV